MREITAALAILLFCIWGILFVGASESEKNGKDALFRARMVEVRVRVKMIQVDQDKTMREIQLRIAWLQGRMDMPLTLEELR